MHDVHRLLSRPVQLHWAGWTTDTLKLQQNGWALSAEQNIYDRSMQIAFRHEQLAMRGVTAKVDWDYYRDIEPRYSSPFGSPMPDLPVAMMGSKVYMHMHGHIPFAYKPIDAMPRITEERIESLDDVVHFAPALTRTQQVIVPEENVEDLMQRILEMQQGARIERIRAEVKEGSYLPFEQKQKFHAQIVSVAA